MEVKGVLYDGSDQCPVGDDDVWYRVAGIYFGKDELGQHLLLIVEKDEPCIFVRIMRLERSPDLDRQLDAIPFDAPVCIEHTGLLRDGAPVFRINFDKERKGCALENALVDACYEMNEKNEIADLRRITGTE